MNQNTSDCLDIKSNGSHFQSGSTKAALPAIPTFATAADSERAHGKDESSYLERRQLQSPGITYVIGHARIYGACLAVPLISLLGLLHLTHLSAILRREVNPALNR